MFKNEGEFEKTVSRLNIDNKPNPVHRGNLRREMLSVFGKTKQQTQRRITPLGVFRRTIMRRSITKIAAAAAIIIVAILVLHNGSVDVAAPAFGVEDVVSALKKTEWVHCVSKFEEVNVDAETTRKMDVVGSRRESWESVHPARRFSRLDNGKIYSIEEDIGRISHYDPQTNTITVVYKDPSDSKETYDSIVDMYAEQIAAVVKIGAEVKYEEGVHDGRPVQIIDVNATSKGGMNTRVSIIVDPETYLPQKLTLRQVRKDMHFTISAVFDYPQTGPKDIYALGVPRTAEIVDEADGAAENLPR